MCMIFCSGKCNNYFSEWFDARKFQNRNDIFEAGNYNFIVNEMGENKTTQKIIKL